MIKLVQISLALAAVVLGVIAYRVQVDDFFSPGNRALAIVAVAWAFFVAGLVAWSRRRGNRLGPLMIAAAFALLLRQLRYDHDPLSSRSSLLSAKSATRSSATRFSLTPRDA